ncbi:12299_t:CDS:2, partial [Dentiscutata heterogama]
KLGFIVSNLHYGSYSRFWWEFSSENLIFPIRLKQQIKVVLNDANFYLSIQIGTKNNAMLPQYYCRSEHFEAIENSLTKAISTVYQLMFHTETRYSGHLVMGWNNKDILEIIRSDIKFFPITYMVGEYKSLLWTKSSNPNNEKESLANLYKTEFLTSSPIHIRTSTDKFWSCFDRALEDNKHTLNGKRRILSIIVDEFSYFELQHNLGISQAIKRYIKLGSKLESGNDIEDAIKDISGTRVANLTLNRNNDKGKLGTIAGISNLHEWTWPSDENNMKYIRARAMPKI